MKRVPLMIALAAALLAMAPMNYAHAAEGYQKEASAVATWWASDRFRDVVRPYSAQRVAALRETLHQEYPSNIMAKKAWNLFKELQAKGGYSHTFGAMDPVQVVEMAPYLTSVYVSGWQCSSTASTSNEPGPDFADYPMDTVPNKVAQLFEAQRFHDRKQNEQRSRLSAEEAKITPSVDYLRPIIADADTGHGGLSAVMKLTKLFIQRGAAGIHLEDQKPGTKKCGHMSGKVLVATQEHCDRLSAARLQADIMGSELMIVARTDAEAANLLDTNIDPRDHAFILGTTRRNLIPLADLIRLATEPKLESAKFEKLQASDPALAQQVMQVRQAQDQAKTAALNNLTDSWAAQAHLTTYAAAVGNALEERQPKKGWDKATALQTWREATDPLKGLSHSDAVALAKQLGVEIYWDWDAPRTFEGYYQITGGVPMAIVRSRAFAPYADMLWMETAEPSLAEAKEFAEGVKAVYPNKFLAYNLSPSFNWDKFGMSNEQLAAFQDELGHMGYVWQFITLAGFHGDALFAKTFAEDFAKRKILAYVETIQRQERANKVPALTHQKWSGVDLLGAQQDAATAGRMSTGAGGAKSTEHQFRR
jgi:isocitrate lyase